MDSPFFQHPEEICQLLSATWRGVTYNIFDDVEFAHEGADPWFGGIMGFKYIANSQSKLPEMSVQVSWYEKDRGNKYIFHGHKQDLNPVQ